MEILQSKSFWSSVAVILSMILVSVAPALEGQEDVLIQAFTAIGIALVIGHKGKDIALGFASKPETPAVIEDHVPDKAAA